MARFGRLEVLQKMIETGMVPVFYSANLEVVKNVAAAVWAGGCPFLEYTNRGDHAWEIFTELDRYCARELPNVILGVGSVWTRVRPLSISTVAPTSWWARSSTPT